MPRALLALLLLITLLATGCDSGPAHEPPAGWTADGEAAWWQEDVDPTLALRDLSGFETMGLSPREDGLREESPIVRNIQRRFLPLYRNHPEIVDSVFAATSLSLIEREGRPGAGTDERDELVRQVHRRIHRVFYPAQPLPREATPIEMPDSLRANGVSGTIALQIYLDEGGHPLAIRRLEGVHPTMDAIVMRNFAERRWQPAHLQGQPVRSWIRTSVNIGS
jgi:hypothetical protein